MEKLFIKETLNSPKVIFDPSKKRYEISGKSFPENSRAFYEPIIEWVKEAAPGHEKIRISFIFDYISSSSVISLKQLLSKIKAVNEAGADIEVLWHYDAADPDIKNIGEEYEKVIGMKLQFIERPA